LQTPTLGDLPSCSADNSLNAPSISFRLAQGFREVGRLEGIGCKFGQIFDVVLMQRSI